MKKMMPVAAAVLAAGMVLSGPAYAAPKEHVKSVKIQKEKQMPQQNKGQIQQFKSIDKKLDKIEAIINHYQEKLPILEEPIEDGEEVQDGNAAPEEPLPEENNDGTASTDAGLTEEQSAEAAGKSEPVSKKSISMALTAQGEAGSEEESDSDSVPDGMEENDEEIDDNGEEHSEAGEENQSTDEENGEAEDLEEEVNQYPGYAGKFHALENRLNAVTSQLNHLASKGVASEELQTRYDRVESLLEMIDTSLTALNELQNRVKEEIETDKTAKKMASTENVPMTKEWTIQFSQKLDPNTVSNMDVVVLDEEQNLVETSISYSEETKSVKISPNQPYKAGESYTIYVGKKISGKSGKALKNSVKMDFTVK